MVEHGRATLKVSQTRKLPIIGFLIRCSEAVCDWKGKKYGAIFFGFRRRLRHFYMHKKGLTTINVRAYFWSGFNGHQTQLTQRTTPVEYKQAIFPQRKHCDTKFVKMVQSHFWRYQTCACFLNWKAFFYGVLLYSTIALRGQGKMSEKCFGVMPLSQTLESHKHCHHDEHTYLYSACHFTGVCFLFSLPAKFFITTGSK